ncbi:hypothetical protein K883_05243 [Mycobacterium sp. TKK-01-0059]|nr:hypothetical protein [Mycobacterium sp. TKK-01-0059]KEF95058.1 hypothetical protein K883_05243 [Mycobacterium sp. TKK-01-0059]
MGRVQRNAGAFYAPLVALARPSKLLNRHRGPGVGLYTVVEHSRQ